MYAVRFASCATALAIVLAGPAAAAVIGSSPNADFSTTPVTIEFGGGQATYTFSNTGDFFSPVGVQTGGTATIASLGAPFFNPPRPTSFFTDEGRAPFIDDGLLAQFLSFSAPAAVPFSISDSFLALRFTLTDGVRFGFARVAGTTLFDIAFESAPGVGIQAGPIVAQVPEPAMIALFGLGLAGVLVARRRRRAVAG